MRTCGLPSCPCVPGTEECYTSRPLQPIFRALERKFSTAHAFFQMHFSSFYWYFLLDKKNWEKRTENKSSTGNSGNPINFSVENHLELQRQKEAANFFFFFFVSCFWNFFSEQLIESLKTTGTTPSRGVQQMGDMCLVCGVFSASSPGVRYMMLLWAPESSWTITVTLKRLEYLDLSVGRNFTTVIWIHFSLLALTSFTSSSTMLS